MENPTSPPVSEVADDAGREATSVTLDIHDSVIGHTSEADGGETDG